LTFSEHRLDNGLQIVAELNPNVYSVAVAFFVRTGARDETPEVSGVSHFLEHMAFKGTAKYSADDVNRIFDELGAKYNASTSEEVTLFYAAILPEYLPKTFEILSSIVYPALRQEDFEMEKKVILEEIGMYEDLPTFTAYEKAMQTHFAGHPLSQCILGTNDSIGALSADQMRQYHREHYRAGNIVLAVAGKTGWDEIRELAERHCSAWPDGAFDRPVEEARPEGGTTVVHKPKSMQQHAMLLNTAPPSRNDLRYAAEILSVIVGDDSGSRLYWELVDPGHAESAELSYNEYDGSGAFAAFLSCEPERLTDNVHRLREVFDTVNRDGVTDLELQQAKNKVASRIVLRSERPMGRLGSLGGNWIYRQEYRSIDDDLKTLRTLTIDDIRRLTEAYPLGWISTATVGPLEKVCF